MLHDAHYIAEQQQQSPHVEAFLTFDLVGVKLVSDTWSCKGALADGSPIVTTVPRLYPCSGNDPIPKFMACGRERLARHDAPLYQDSSRARLDLIQDQIISLR